jgi:outer membrane protein insertion porin family
MSQFKRLLICGCAAAGFAAAHAPATALAQTAPPANPLADATRDLPPTAPAAAPAPVIQQLVVRGNQRVETATVLAYVALQPGDPFDPERIDQSLKELFRTGFFADVQFAQQGGALVINVVENPTVNQVLFEGNSAVTKDKLEKEVQIKPRAWYTQSRVQADVRRILEVYRRSGKFAASVAPKVKEQPQNRVDLIFEITEGPTTNIRRVNFIGNKEYSDNQLKDIVATEESSWWKFYSSKDNYDPDKLDYDREELRKFYLNNGHFDFRVKSAVAELTPDQRAFFVTYTLDEGAKYNFGEVTVNTQLAKLSGQILRAFVPIQTGALYQRDLIEKSIEAITFAAGSAGYAFVDVRPREIPDREGRTVAVTFDVDEGPRVYIERIDIVGNSATLDQVIRREMRLSEGDAFNRVLIDRSKNRVKALGFFKEVEIEEKPGSLPDRTVVEVKVEEQATGELAFGLGYSSAEAYQFDISISERNLRGRGQFLRFRISASSRTQNVDIRFTEPRFLGRNIAAGMDIFSVRQDFITEAGFETQSSGASIRVGFPLAEDRNLGLRYTFRQDSITVPTSTCFDAFGLPLLNAPLICQSVGDYTTSLGGYTFNWDRRNDPIRPTRGFDLSISQDLAGIGTGVKYLRTEFSGGVYRGLFPGWTASAQLSAGHITGWGDDTVRVNDRFFKGGQSFRGFEIAGLGPRQVFAISEPLVDSNGVPTGQYGPARFEYGDALGGKIYAISTFELTVPTPLPESYGIRGALFMDVGTLGQLDDVDIVRRDRGPGVFEVTRDALAIRASAGLSVFWTSPFGPIRFDFSYPFMKQTYDQTENFRFSTATQF